MLISAVPSTLTSTMITYFKDQLLLIRHSRTLLTRQADKEVISILRENSCPITQLKRRNRRRRGWMAGLRRVAPEKMTLPCIFKYSTHDAHLLDYS